MTDSKTPFGFSDDILSQLTATIKKHNTVKKALLYGSRARGDFKQGSDIDISIDAPNMTDRQFAILWNEIDSLPIVYSMDISHLQKITKPPLLKKIAEEGIDILHNNQNNDTC